MHSINAVRKSATLAYRISYLKIKVHATLSFTTLTDKNGLSGRSKPVTYSQRVSLGSLISKRHLRRPESQYWNMLKRYDQRMN